METNILKSLRQKNNYTEDFVADILNMSQSAYSRLEHGQTALSLPRAQQLSALYNVDLNIIAGRTSMKKNEYLYNTIYDLLKKKKFTSTELHQHLIDSLGLNIKLTSLRTLLYREVKKNNIQHENNLYWISQSTSDTAPQSKRRYEMLEKYINDMIQITVNQEKKLLINLFENYPENETLLEAKEVYLFNKDLQTFLKEKKVSLHNKME